jgi:hypothetical protein
MGLLVRSLAKFLLILGGIRQHADAAHRSVPTICVANQMWDHPFDPKHWQEASMDISKALW